MKIPNKREFTQTAYNHSSDIELKDFMKQTMYCKTIFLWYIFLVFHATLASGNPLRFRGNLLERM